MRIIFVINLLTSVAQAEVTAQLPEVPSNTDDVQQSTDNSAGELIDELVSELLERALRTVPIDSAELDDTTLQKPGNVAVRSNRGALLSRPSGMTPLPLRSPLAGPMASRGCDIYCQAIRDNDMSEAHGRRDTLAAILGAFSAAATVGTDMVNPKMALADGGFTDGPDGIKYKDVKVGTGDEARGGRFMGATYILSIRQSDGEKKRIYSGKKKFRISGFASPPKTGRVELGAFDISVIKGWPLGFVGKEGSGMEPMKVGGTRQIILPPSLAYGDKEGGCSSRAQNNGRISTQCIIPPNSELEIQIKFDSIATS